MDGLLSHILFIGTGITTTLVLLFGALSMGLILGTFISICRYNKKGLFFFNRLVSLIRGTPLILQISFIYFSLPTLLGIKLDILSAGIISMGANSAAYIAEIIRGGLESLPQGQFEAAKTLGIPTFYMWKDIILIQVFKNIFPSLVNEMIALLKETSLIATIGGLDLMRHSQIVAAEQYTYFIPLCIAGAYYYLLVISIEFVGKKIEQRGFYA